MARIIDEGWVDREDPTFTEGVKIISICKQREFEEQEERDPGRLPK